MACRIIRCCPSSFTAIAESGSGTGGPVDLGWHEGRPAVHARLYSLPVTIRMSARIAGLAILAAELAAGLSQMDSRPKLVWVVLFALQVASIVWITDQRSMATLRLAAPAVLAGLSAAAVWVAFAFAAPVAATGNLLALVAIAVAGLVVAVWPRRHTGQRLLPRVLIAAASAALTIFLAISWVMPSDSRFVSNNHPPVWPVATRLVDPILEFAIFVLLALALGADRLRALTRGRRTAAQQARALYVAGPNEMTVEPPTTDVPPIHSRDLVISPEK